MEHFLSFPSLPVHFHFLPVLIVISVSNRLVVKVWDGSTDWVVGAAQNVAPPSEKPPPPPLPSSEDDPPPLVAQDQQVNHNPSPKIPKNPSSFGVGFSLRSSQICRWMELN